MPHSGSPLNILHVDHPNVVIETVKRVEDGRDWIVRLYESQRRNGHHLTMNIRPKRYPATAACTIE